jgi:hypothetical protein
MRLNMAILSPGVYKFKWPQGWPGHNLVLGELGPVWVSVCLLQSAMSGYHTPGKCARGISYSHITSSYFGQVSIHCHWTELTKPVANSLGVPFCPTPPPVGNMWLKGISSWMEGPVLPRWVLRTLFHNGYHVNYNSWEWHLTAPPSPSTHHHPWGRPGQWHIIWTHHVPCGGWRGIL